MCPLLNFCLFMTYKWKHFTWSLHSNDRPIFFYLDPGQLIKSPFEENDEKQSDYEEDIDVPITNLASNRSSITVGWITASVVCT